MDSVDMNLLAALDALLAEGSVTGAARRLGLSSSAMSRTLARLRSATGDPLLVRAGRGLVPTPYATELRERVHELSRDVRAVLRPTCQPSGRRLARANLHHSRQRRVCRRPFRILGGRYHRGCASVSACVSRRSPRRMLSRFGRGRLILRSACSAPSRRRFAGNLYFETPSLGWLGSDIHFFRAQTLRPKDMRLAVMLLRQGKGNSRDQLTTPWENLGSDRRSSLSCRDFLMRCASLATRTWSRLCRVRVSACLQPIRQRQQDRTSASTFRFVLRRS